MNMSARTSAGAMAGGWVARATDSWRPIAVVLVLVAIACGTIVFLYGFSEQLESSSPVLSQGAEIPTSLWFDGETLIAVRELQGTQLAIRRWPASQIHPPEWQMIDLQNYSPRAAPNNQLEQIYPNAAPSSRYLP